MGLKVVAEGVETAEAWRDPEAPRLRHGPGVLHQQTPPGRGVRGVGPRIAVGERAGGIGRDAEISPEARPAPSAAGARGMHSDVPDSLEFPTRYLHLSAQITELDLIRVVAMVGSPESHLAMNDCLRAPAVGDVGTVVGLDPPRLPTDRKTQFVVESCDDEGNTVWLAQFSRNEIRLVERPRAIGEHGLQSSRTTAEVNPEVFDHLREEWLAQHSADDIHRKYVEELGILPLLSDMGGFYGLTRDGQVLEFDWDSLEPELVVDPHPLHLALFQGAAAYPALRTMLPPRPVNARTCVSCDGTGEANVPTHLQDKVVCYCGGAGWVPRELQNSRVPSRLRRGGSSGVSDVTLKLMRPAFGPASARRSDAVRGASRPTGTSPRSGGPAKAARRSRWRSGGVRSGPDPMA